MLRKKGRKTCLRSRMLLPNWEREIKRLSRIIARWERNKYINRDLLDTSSITRVEKYAPRPHNHKRAVRVGGR